MTYASRRDRWCSIFGIVSVVLLFFGTEASSLDTIHMAITGKNFQHVIYPIAQEKGYMREEGKRKASNAPMVAGKQASE